MIIFAHLYMISFGTNQVGRAHMETSGWIIIIGVILSGIGILVFWKIYDRYVEMKNPAHRAPVSKSECSVVIEGKHVDVIKISDDKVLLGTANYDDAITLGFERADKYYYEKWLDMEEFLKAIGQQPVSYSFGNRLISRACILDVNVTENTSISGILYLVWRDHNGRVFVTGISSGTNYEDLIKIRKNIREKHFLFVDTHYTRFLCDYVSELESIGQDKIEKEAYGAYMDGAR